MQIYKKNFKTYLKLACFLFVVGVWCGNLLYHIPGYDVYGKELFLFSEKFLDYVLNNFFYFFYAPTLFALIGGVLGFLSGLLAYAYNNDSGVYRPNEEHGSARFATKEELEMFQDPIFENNLIFTQHARMGLFSHRLSFHAQKNKNVCVVGGPGTGKTYTFIKPNIMQMNASFVVTDPKGLLVRETGKMLEDNGYKVKVFDLNTLSNSDGFNVFNYIKTELDVDRVLEAITEGTKKSENQGEDFWQVAEALLIRSFIAFLWFDGIDNDYTPNLSMIADMLRFTERKDPKVPSPVELWFEEQNRHRPNNYAYKQWCLFNNNYKAETRASVVSIAVGRYAVFDHEQVVDMVKVDTMEIDKWNEEKTAVFIAIPETTAAYNFLAAIFMATTMEVLRKKADEVLTGVRKLKEQLLHVRFLIDEFANIGKLPNIDKALATFRSREMSIVIVLQALDQIKTMYRNGWATILNTCDSFLFLGGDEKETTSYLSQRAGKQTIAIRNHSISRGRNGGSENRQKQARDLLTPDEIGRLNNGDALLFISGQHVFKDKKYTVKDHPNSSQLANSPNDANWYYYKRYRDDYERFMDNVTPDNIVDHGILQDVA
ncbi:type IV secretion system protein VirD4 [Pilibacter termitis]|uniref:Type IV secretion system protein VirD4 n=1 Tax=Pilibacter termitis TaxID=263852 RepID=A0A1T4KTE9_9ENTE|nr:type IV secretory system conjugative DNA transfer family protein [Pilibacter termitis]SJZ45630.1 type IV secretion system protein VirD4 [Pilibacter termitis]